MWGGYVGKRCLLGTRICVKLRSEFDAKRERMELERSWLLSSFVHSFMSRSSLMKLLHRF